MHAVTPKANTEPKHTPESSSLSVQSKFVYQAS